MKDFIKPVLHSLLALSLVLFGLSYDVLAETDQAHSELIVPGKTELRLAQPKAEAAIATTFSIPVQAQSADLSDHLEIPAIGVHSAITSVGLNAAGEIAVPADHVGRWNGGVQPGEAGVVFLDGHVFGVFSGLKNLGIASEINLVWGGHSYRYRVVGNQTYALSELHNTTNGLWSSILYSPRGGSKGLNIMTCAGQPTGGTYSHRTVVYAQQI